jgi:hypothetical protein
MNINDPTGRLARWSLFLQAFDFDIVHKKGSTHSNVDTLSRPVLLTSLVENKHSEHTDSLTKTLDPLEDKALLYYVQKRKHNKGTSKNQCKRVEQAAQHYKWEHKQLWYRADTESGAFRLVPPKAERKDIALRAHLLGHFQVQTTFNRLQEEYHWPKMIKTAEEVVLNCAQKSETNQIASTITPPEHSQ